MSSRTRDAPGLRVVEPKLMPLRVDPGMLRRARLFETLDGDSGTGLTVLNANVGYAFKLIWIAAPGWLREHFGLHRR